jgi:predicted ATPase/DNA-binding SARP family transcriptional activator
VGQLSLRLLGAPEVRHSGAPVTFATRKALALLVYLAVEGGRHSRERIADLFWPDSDPERGRAALRRTLARLREALGEDAAGHPTSHLWVRNDALGFVLSREVELDLALVEAAYVAARDAALPAAGGTSALPQRLVALRRAAESYRADFLEGFSLPDAPEFDDWAAQQRERWHLRLGRVLDRLSQLQFEGGETAAALDTTARWRAHDPWNEAAYRRLILIHLTTGDRAAALRDYQACREILARELYAEPAPETEALAERARAPLPAPGDSALEGRGAPPSPASGLLVGRSAEHLALVTAYRAARRGRPTVVTMEGEPGIGKTRLAKEFLSWARAQGATVLEGRAFETSGRLPYQPLVEAIRDAPASGEPLSAFLSQNWLAELSQLLPELRDDFPTLPTPVHLDEAAARLRLFEAVARFGQALAGRAPSVLFVDDLQWADAGSLDLVQYAGRRWAAAKAPILVLFSVRAEDLASDPRLQDWLGQLGRELPASRLPLGPLSLEATREFVAFEQSRRGGEPLGSAALDARAQELHAASGGQPFFLVEALQAQREAGSEPSVLPNNGLADPDEARARTPGAGWELVRSRLQRLTPPATVACLAGAVLGDRYRFEEMVRVADLTENAALSAVEELVRRGLLREHADRYMFTHDRIREVAYGEASDTRRRVFHRRALEALEQAGQPPALLARHALGAGLSERAFALALAAGDAAMRVFAVRDAAGHYERARELAAQMASGQVAEGQWHHLFQQLGRAYELSGDRPRAHTTYEAMCARARAAQSPAMECAALNRLATLVAQEWGDFPRASALLEAARALAEANEDPTGLVETEWNLAQAASYRLDVDAARTHGERALALARRLGREGLVARSLQALAFAERYDRLEAAAGHAAEARVRYAALGDRVLEADCLSILATAQIRLGQPRVAVAAARSAWAIGTEIENDEGRASSARALGLALLECGAYGEAQAVMRKGVEAARRAGLSPLLGLALITLGTVARLCFDLETARATHREAHEILERLGDSPTADLAITELCADAGAAGDWTVALGMAERLASGRRSRPGEVPFWLCYEIEALARADRGERAAAVLDGFARQAGESPRYELAFLRARAALARARNQPGAATEHLQAARHLAESLELPGELWQVEGALGETLAATGDREGARSVKVRAAATLARLADGIGERELRERFLSAPPVAAVLGRPTAS